MQIAVNSSSIAYTLLKYYVILLTHARDFFSITNTLESLAFSLNHFTSLDLRRTTYFLIEFVYYRCLQTQMLIFSMKPIHILSVNLNELTIIFWELL